MNNTNRYNHNEVFIIIIIIITEKFNLVKRRFLTLKKIKYTVLNKIVKN